MFKNVSKSAKIKVQNFGHIIETINDRSCVKCLEAFQSKLPWDYSETSLMHQANGQTLSILGDRY